MSNEYRYSFEEEVYSNSDNDPEIFTPIDVLANYNIEDVTSFSLFTLFRSNDGSVFASGTNETFKLGLGHTKKVHHPVLMNIPYKVVSTSDGYNHCLFLTENHMVLASGDNEWGQLNLGEEYLTSTITPQIISFHSLIDLNTDASTFGIKVIACGGHHSAFITLDDRVALVGCNAYGQLGISSNVKRLYDAQYLLVNGTYLRAKQISCGRRHTAVLDLDNRVWTFGENTFGQCGVPDTTPKKQLSIPIDITPQFSEYGIGCAISSDDYIVEVICGFNYTFFISKSKRIFTCGSNADNKIHPSPEKKISHPELIDIDFTYQHNEVPSIACGFFHTVIYKKVVSESEDFNK